MNDRVVLILGIAGLVFVGLGATMGRDYVKGLTPHPITEHGSWLVVKDFGDGQQMWWEIKWGELTRHPDGTISFRSLRDNQIHLAGSYAFAKITEPDDYRSWEAARFMLILRKEGDPPFKDPLLNPPKPKKEVPEPEASNEQEDSRPPDSVH